MVCWSPNRKYDLVGIPAKVFKNADLESVTPELGVALRVTDLNGNCKVLTVYRSPSSVWFSSNVSKSDRGVGG
ncbi:hypothetical protein N7450_001800 [Penicillium hetheringtonii]|uniref:Uncharacterized protein n=1 Tax=Penicillium hetheringtonii TaxID=911720 RepID=A0AAD6E623_9EURO|nr:hypothetical protein N7450_001800 [Penicillium hetheringtonii]